MKAIFLFVALFATISLSAQSIKVNKDTAEIPGNVHFIRIDGKVYEIKRETSLQEVKKEQPWHWGGMTLDSAVSIPSTIRWYNATTPAIGIVSY